MKRILVIDDDVQMRQLLRQILERAGYQVADAPDGETGIEIYRQEPTDLVITDLIMPRKDGMETIIELKRDYPAAKIIAISGGSRAMDPKDYLRYTAQFGVLHTLTKPFTPQEMLDDVRTELQDQVEATAG
jgi:two-component system chemotaxis response regulator CheY